MTANLRSLFCLALALAMIGLNSAYSQQGIILEGNSLSDRGFSSDIVPGDTLFVVDFTVTNAGTVQDIVTWSETSLNGSTEANQTFRTYVLRPVDGNFQVMTDSGDFIVADLGTNFFPVPPFALQVGDLIAHYGRGIPLTTGTGGPSTCYYNGSVLPMPSVGDTLQLPGPDYPLFNDGGRNYAIAVNIGARFETNVPQALNIALASGSVIVSWSTGHTNALLQTTDLAGDLWTSNTNFVSNNGTNSLTIPSPAGNMFFKLGSP